MNDGLGTSQTGRRPSAYDDNEYESVPQQTRQSARSSRSDRSAASGQSANAAEKVSHVARSAGSAVGNLVGGIASRVKGASAASSDVSGSVAGSSPRRRSNQQSAEDGYARTGGSSDVISARGDYQGTGVPCVKCGRPVEPSQMRCPHCGAFQRPIYTNPVFIIPVIVIIVLVIVLTIAIGSCRSNDIGQSDNPSSTTSTTSNVAASSDSLTALNEAIQQAQTYIANNESMHIYTSVSISSLETACAQAVSVSNTENVDQGSVDTALDNLNNAEAALVQLASYSTVEWPYYDALSQSIDTYVGSQIAMNGSISNVTDGTTGRTIVLNVSADPTCPVVLTTNSLTSSDVDPAVGVEIQFLGTVTGTAQVTLDDGTTVDAPAITVDDMTEITLDTGEGTDVEEEIPAE